MASRKKQRKQVNSYQVKGSLKDKGTGIKRLSFYTSSERKRLNKVEVQNDGMAERGEQT